MCLASYTHARPVWTSARCVRCESPTEPQLTRHPRSVAPAALPLPVLSPFFALPFFFPFFFPLFLSLFSFYFFPLLRCRQRRPRRRLVTW